MILAIDLGSSFFKAAVYDRKLEQIGIGNAQVPYLKDTDSQVEVAVEDAESAFSLAVDEALSSAQVKAPNLLAVSVTSQAQTFTVYSADGGHRTPFISWRDTRPAHSRSGREGPADFSFHSSVYEYLPLLMAAKLRWLQRESGSQVLWPGDLVLMLPTWFVYKLTGTAVVDANLASMSGLYSLVENRWWDDALTFCGVDHDNMPFLAPLGACAGSTGSGASRYGLPSGIAVFLAGNDQTAGAYGARIQDRNALLVTLGTAQVVYDVCPELPDPVPGTMRGPYPKGSFYRLAADEFGTGTVDSACEMLNGCDGAADFDRMALDGETVDSGVVFIADETGGKGRWRGGSERTTADEKAHAVLVCLTERLMKMFDVLGERTTNRPVLLAGGGSNSLPWVSLIRKQLGARIQGITTASPSLGAALMARDFAEL